jgi:sulfur-oxidizing protein SoxY
MIYAKRNNKPLRQHLGQVRLTRRQVLGAFVASVLLPVINPSHAVADVPEHLLPLIHEVTGRVMPTMGKVKLTLPPLAESGNSVPLKIQVESPMTAGEYVKSIHVFSEKNPRPVIARFHLSPQSGKAEINTRIRLAGTQHVLAVAIMSDGSAWLGSTEVVVTAAACIDEK